MNTAKQIIAGVMIYFTVIGQVFGQAALLPNAEQQYFDNNGHPLASGTVTYYVPGTTTKKTTWQNSTQSINNTNPVTLDIGGKGIMYGQGSYRQVLQDNLGNVIWDQPTTAFGSSSPSGATGTDTAPVGTVLPYSGFVVPTNWQLAYGQALSRTTFAALEAAITISAPNVGCINTSTTLTGFTDTSIIRVGAPIEATCLPTSTTVASITNATTIVVSQAAASTLTVTATIFPWGNGDQVSTFNAPDLRGRSAVGADCMGYVASGNACAGNLTATYYGANPGAGGQTGGTQSKNLTIANLNSFTPTINSITPAGTITNGAITFSTMQVNSTATGANAGFTTGPSTANADMTPRSGVAQAATTFAGTPVTPTMPALGSGTAHSVVNPDATVNYIIKVTPNSTGAGGVVSFGGMIGDIVCASTLTCAPIGTVNTVGCTTATVSQLGCVQPDGTTITISGGVITANAGIASSIVIGSTTISGGTNTDILFDNAGVLGQLGVGTNVASTLANNLNATGGIVSPTPTRAGDLIYWDGTQWNHLAGNNSGTQILQETSSGVLSWATVSGTGTVTSIICGTGLSGGTITSSGTCSITSPIASSLGGTGVVSPIAHTIPINEGATAQANTGVGTLGQALVSGGTGADPAYKSGTRVLLNTLTASNSTSVSDLSSFTSNYNEYEIVFENVLPATNNTTCEILVHNSGSFPATGYLSIGMIFTGAAPAGQTATTFIPCSASGGLSSTIGISGTFRVFNPSTASTHQWNGTWSHQDGAVVAGGQTAGFWNTSAAIDGFVIFMASGNIASGVVKIYGML